jgi:hypothetical protein
MTDDIVKFYLFSKEERESKESLIIEFELAALEVDKARKNNKPDDLIKALEKFRKAVKNLKQYIDGPEGDRLYG